MKLAFDRPRLICTFLLAGLIPLTLTACSSATNGNDPGETAPASPKNDSFLTDGKGDTLYDVQPGSPKAAGILKLANTASLEGLDDDVSLDVRAAENIVRERKDAKIATLRELDAISWVGSRAFGKLYRYADDNGYFPEDSPSGTTETVHGVKVGSRTAWAVLRIANSSTRKVLDHDVALDSRAADRIVEARATETGENFGFESLQQLSAVDWVADRAFSKMVAYGRAHGWTRTSIHGYAAGSPEAIGIVRAANAPERIDEIENAFGFSESFATKFRTHRNTRTTAGTFDLLVELDRLDGADQSMFDALLAHARQAELVPETIHGVREQTYRAREIIRLVNDAGTRPKILDDRAGLDSRAAANIEKARPVESLDELVAIPYVAQTAIRKLDAFTDAYGNGVVSYCGDGLVAGGHLEECDDDNHVSGDGCSANCRVEHVCGNGIVETGETCDDGNGLSNDGCAARTCQLEVLRETGDWRGNESNGSRSTAQALGSYSRAKGGLSGSYSHEDVDFWSFEVSEKTSVAVDIWQKSDPDDCGGVYVRNEELGTSDWEIFEPPISIQTADGRTVASTEAFCANKWTNDSSGFDLTAELDAGTYYIKVGPFETGAGWDGPWRTYYKLAIQR